MRKRQLLILPLLLSATLAMQAQRVTISCHNRAAESAFKELMTQSGKNFIYPAGLLKGVRVTVTARNEELRTVLNRMFSDTGITYTIRGNNVVLKRDKKKASTQPKKKTAKAPEAPKSVTVSGFVREKKSGEALTGATVHDPASGLYTQTNATGFYSLQTRPGSLTLIASYPGFDADTVSAGTRRNVNFSLREGGTALNEVVVTADKNRSLTMESPSIGALNLSRADILATPALLGESDVIKTLQLQPGVSAGVEGLAGMYVHGGNADENLYTLDNVPLYQVNHFGGLFSAFNTEAIRTVDFYKSSFPAKFDSRLSSYMDVHTRDGNMEKFSGSFKLGLTSGALSLEGPIWKGHTSYSVAVRRSWYDVFTVPVLAIVNARKETDTKTIFRYAFTDVNAKINHRFSDTSRAYVMFYYGNDFLKGGSEDKPGHYNYYYEKEVNTLSWGNTVASAGWQYTLTPTLLGQLTASYSHYGSSMKRESKDGDVDDKGDFYNLSVERLRSSNNIDDISARLDFDWRPGGGNNVQFGASYIWHTFLPQRAHRSLESDEYSAEVLDEGRKYRASQWDFYLSDDWQPLECLRLDGGLHFSLFNITGRTHSQLSPRLSARLTLGGGWALKAGYAHTVQYVHQLQESSLSLPTDRWIPIIGDQKPASADNFSVAAYFDTKAGWTFSAEAYLKKMHNLLEYRDEHYLLPPEATWDNTLCAGRGLSRGIDFKVARHWGALSGHVAYSLLWADRTFADRNGGKTYPARFDNRHKINVLLCWKINDKWEVAASWTGMSGNRITLAMQDWEDGGFGPWNNNMTLVEGINNYRLPFYHRLDLSATRHTRHGYWTFSLYNAYCHINTIAVRRDYANDYQWVTDQWGNQTMTLRPVFQKVKLIPVIPSVSYTWLF